MAAQKYFNQLSKKWSSGTTFYQTSQSFDDTDIETLFNTAFCNESINFFDDSSSVSVLKDKSYWNDIQIQKASSCSIVRVKQRAFFLKTKKYAIASTHILQTAFSHSDGSLIIFSVAKNCEKSESSKYIIADQWSIKSQQENDQKRSKISISLIANIILKNSDLRSAAVFKSKWLKFYQQQSQTWNIKLRECLQSTQEKIKNIYKESVNQSTKISKSMITDSECFVLINKDEHNDDDWEIL